MRSALLMHGGEQRESHKEYRIDLAGYLVAPVVLNGRPERVCDTPIIMAVLAIAAGVFILLNR